MEKERFFGTKSTKRNQKSILEQQYENFMAGKNETMTQSFDRFNKLVGELATIGVQTSFRIQVCTPHLLT